MRVVCCTHCSRVQKGYQQDVQTLDSLGTDLITGRVTCVQFAILDLPEQALECMEKPVPVVEVSCSKYGDH